MADDQTFRLILALGLIAVLPFGIYHRVRSQASREKLDRRQEGLFILLTLRPISLAAWFGLLTFVASPAWMAWSSVPLPVWLRWVGVGFGTAGGALLTLDLSKFGHQHHRHGRDPTTSHAGGRPARTTSCGIRSMWRLRSPSRPTRSSRPTGSWRSWAGSGWRCWSCERAAPCHTFRRQLRALHEADWSVLPACGVHVNPEGLAVRGESPASHRER